jgi:hypothetical protein
MINGLYENEERCRKNRGLGVVAAASDEIKGVGVVATVGMMKWHKLQRE